MAIKALRLAFHLFPNYRIVCRNCAMLLEVEEAKDLTIIEQRGELSVDVAAVTCPNCQHVTHLPEREQRVALNLRESVPNDNYYSHVPWLPWLEENK